MRTIQRLAHRKCSVAVGSYHFLIFLNHVKPGPVSQDSLSQSPWGILLCASPSPEARGLGPAPCEHVTPPTRPDWHHLSQAMAPLVHSTVGFILSTTMT